MRRSPHAIPADAHVLVTGAANGIGEALARRFARDPALKHGRLTLIDINAPGLARVARSLPCATDCVGADLTQLNRLPEMIEGIQSRGGPIDVLVNNAGVMFVRSATTASWPQMMNMLELDLLAPLRLIQLCTPHMLERRAGCVVNISSMAGLTPVAGCMYYGAAKAGLAMASEVLRMELAHANVHVVSVYPGPIHTSLERSARAQLHASWLASRIPTGTPSKLADLVVDACHQQRARVVYPRSYLPASWLPALGTQLTSRLSPMPRD